MKKTLLILGAGASKDVYSYFPTGLELIKDINSHLTVEPKHPTAEQPGGYLSPLTNMILSSLENCSIEDIHLLKQHLWDHVRHYEYKYLRFNQKTSISIDYFIANQIEKCNLNEKSKAIAQFAISYLLIGSEEALLYILKRKSKSFGTNWIEALHEKLIRYSFDEINCNLSVVSFNYERTFSYLFSRYKSITPMQRDIFNSKVRYIYGSLGDFKNVPFGTKNDSQTMTSVYNNFQLIDINRSAIPWQSDERFETILFLGFGYDPINLQKLNLKIFTSAKKIGTGRNLDEKTKKSLLEKHSIEIFKGTCTELIRKYI